MPRLGNRWRWLLPGLLALLVGCASTGFNTQAYTVKSGDTLYFIAWKYKLDYKQLAAWNQLSPPYAIYPGERILINPVNPAARPAAQPAARPVAQPAASLSAYRVRKGDNLYAIARKHGLSTRRLAQLNKLSPPYTIYPGQRLLLRQSGAAVASTAPPSRPASAAVQSTPQPATRPANRPVSRPADAPAPSAWLWPTQGQVVHGFKGRKTTRQGIDIGGRMGQRVRAAAAGVVVYSGSGLAHYGKLVIVKHNDSFLSAYGYNSQLLVKEGEQVKAGQTIASMGRVGQERPLLHFEIRKNGKPVNPLQHLPKQS